MKNFFPIFKKNKKIIFLDSAASYQKPQIVIDAEKEFYENYYSSI
jgi:cysteine desulfurase/selenocysteine lyase